MNRNHNFTHEIESSPSYETNKNAIWVETNVREDYRRNGIGTEMLRRVTPLMKKANKPEVYGGTSEDSGYRFIEKMNMGIVAMEGTENRLQMKEVDWEMMEDWLNE